MFNGSSGKGDHMKSSHWIMAGVVALALGCTGPAFAEQEKGHHGGGKWREGKMGCDMSPEKRELIHGAMKKAHEQNEGLRKQMEDRHAAMEKVLSAKKFDREAFLKVADEMAALQEQKRHSMAEAFADIAPKLSADERKKCAMFMAGGMHHGMRGRHHGGWRHHGGEEGASGAPADAAPAPAPVSKRGRLNE